MIAYTERKRTCTTYTSTTTASDVDSTAVCATVIVFVAPVFARQVLANLRPQLKAEPQAPPIQEPHRARRRSAVPRALTSALLARPPPSYGPPSWRLSPVASDC